MLHPFAEKLNEKIDHIQIKGDGINPQAFIVGLPEAKLDFDATVVPAFAEGLALEGSIDLLNSAAAPADAGGMPVRTLLGEFTVNDDGLVTISDLTAQLLKKGQLKLSGSINTDKQALDLALLLQDIVAADALKQNLSGSLNGEITVKSGFDAPETAWQFDTGTAKSSGLVQLQNDTALGQQTVLLKKAQILPNGGGEMNAQGRLELFKNQALQLAINSKDFNPGKLNPAFPDGRVNGDINLTGELANNIFSGKMQFRPQRALGRAAARQRRCGV